MLHSIGLCGPVCILTLLLWVRCESMFSNRHSTDASQLSSALSLAAEGCRRGTGGAGQGLPASAWALCTQTKAVAEFQIDILSARRRLDGPASGKSWQAKRRVRSAVASIARVAVVLVSPSERLPEPRVRIAIQAEPQSQGTLPRSIGHELTFTSFGVCRRQQS